MRSVYAYSPFYDNAYARILFLNQRQTYLDNECMQQAELIEELEAQINSLEEKLEKNHELEDSFMVFSKDIKRLYNENVTLAVQIHKIHKFLHSFTKKSGCSISINRVDNRRNHLQNAKPLVAIIN